MYYIFLNILKPLIKNISKVKSVRDKLPVLSTLHQHISLLVWNSYQRHIHCTLMFNRKYYYFID